MKYLWQQLVGFLMNTGLLYYISCCLLLLGAYLMMHSSLLSNDFLIRYYETYGIYWLYEIVLVLLCMQVINKLGIVDDGLILGVLGMLILLDPTFFNNVFYTYRLGVGLSVNACCFLLAAGSLFLLVRFGGIPMTRRMQGGMLLTLVFVYFYPALFNAGMSESFKANYLYLLLWLPYILLLIVERSDQAVEKAKGALATTDKQRLILFRAQVLLLLYVSISHLVESSIGYSLTFYGVYLSPLILALPMLIIKMNPAALEPAGSSVSVWMMTTIALLVSCAQDAPFIHHTIGNFSLTPFRFQLLVNALTLYAVHRLKPKRSFLIGAAAYVFAAFCGYDFGSVLNHIFYLRLVPFALIQLIGMVSVYIVWTSTDPRKNAIFTWLSVVLLGTALIKAHIGIHLFWTIYCIVITAGLFVASIKLHLRGVTVIAILVAAIWLLKKVVPLLRPILERIPDLLGSGIVIIVVAFMALFAGYSLSTLKQREKDKKP